MRPAIVITRPGRQKNLATPLIITPCFMLILWAPFTIILADLCAGHMCSLELRKVYIICLDVFTVLSTAVSLQVMTERAPRKPTFSIRRTLTWN